MLLYDALGGIFVGFFFDVTEVFSLGTFVAKALFVAMQKDVVRTDAAWDFVFGKKGDGLFLWKAGHEIAEHLDVDFTILFHEEVCQGDDGFFAHAVDEEVGT